MDRPAVITAIAEARAHGDISENAEYDAAREKQGFIEGRILELEAKLANAQVIDPALLEDDGRVVFGTTVELMDTASAESVTYQIVGEDEADIKRARSPTPRRSPRPSSGSTRATSPRFGRRAG